MTDLERKLMELCCRVEAGEITDEVGKGLEAELRQQAARQIGQQLRGVNDGGRERQALDAAQRWPQNGGE